MASKFSSFGTNKQDLIVFGGESSADYGMVISEPPAFERASRKQTVYKVPGRNGAVVFQEDAWEDVPRSYRVWLAKDRDGSIVDQVNAVEAWLNSATGYQRLEDSFEQDTFRLAYYSGGEGFTNELMLAGKATIKFTCRAERFLKTGAQEQAITNGSKIFNPTRFASKPLIHLEGSGVIQLNIEGQTMTANLDDYINIDCESRNAYREPTELKNSSIAGTFPKIKPGANTIGITGTLTGATIVPRFFTI